MKIKSSVAVISGGASGLGRACVEELSRMGSNCIILDKKDGIDTAKKSTFYYTDVTNENNIQKSVKNTMASFGAIHILVNCAGVGLPAKVVDTRKNKKGDFIEKFNKTIQINLAGSMNTISIISKEMLKNIPDRNGERGVIINTASIAAFEGQIGQSAYSASKAAIVGMTLPLAREFASCGIRVMCISPGLFDTPMFASISEKMKIQLINKIPFPKRLGFPLEYARLVRHIIENSVLNGENIRIDSALRM